MCNVKSIETTAMSEQILFLSRIKLVIAIFSKNKISKEFSEEYYWSWIWSLDFSFAISRWFHNYHGIAVTKLALIPSPALYLLIFTLLLPVPSVSLQYFIFLSYPFFHILFALILLFNVSRFAVFYAPRPPRSFPRSLHSFAVASSPRPSDHRRKTNAAG